MKVPQTIGLCIIAILLFLLFSQRCPRITCPQPRSTVTSVSPSSLINGPHAPVDCNPVYPFVFHAQTGEDKILYESVWKNSPNIGGLFIEVGAFDGITISNTKFFEDHLHWSGILIEGHPESAKSLIRNNRPKSLKFAQAICDDDVGSIQMIGTGPIAGDDRQIPDVLRKLNDPSARSYRVHCGPLGTLLGGIGVRKIDLFSLDVEGAELVLLKTFNWDILVHIWIIELDGHNPIKDNEVRNLLYAHGYVKSTIDAKSGGLMNEVFELPNYMSRTKDIPPAFFQLKC